MSSSTYAIHVQRQGKAPFLNAELTPLAAEARLRRICEIFPDGIVFSTSLGMEDQVITDIIARNNLPVHVFTLDTGRMFQETYDLLDATTRRYNIPITTYAPDAKQLETLLRSKGANSFYESVENRKECCGIRKVQQLKRALQGATVWITGLRAEQSDNRAALPIIEWDEANTVLKLNPIVEWSWQGVQNYVRENFVPYNRLHDKGFPSIGCAPCTRAVAPDEDIRAGRWWWEQSQKECGLHK